MKLKYTKNEAELIFNKTLQAFGVKIDAKTDPQIMQSVIQEFRLDDFKSANKQFDEIFQNAISKPQELSPFLNDIKKGIISKHSAIIEFADLALKKNWFKSSEHVVRSVHVIYILELLTATMCNNHKFFIEVQNHYKNKEKTYGLNTLHLLPTFFNALKISPNFFDIAKPFALDPLLIYFRIQRGLSKSHISKKDLKKVYKQGDINFLEYKLLGPIQNNHIEHINELVRINIYVAGITEYNNNLKTNAVSAHVLSENLIIDPPQTIFKDKKIIPELSNNTFYNQITEKNNLFPVVTLSQEWTSLYTTWNMVFVLGNLQDLDIIFPKLLIPSIINAESENFLGARFISLWLTINHAIFRKARKSEILGPVNKTEMAKAWSIINKKYSLELARQEIHENSETLLKNYNRFYIHPIFNLFKIVKIFMFGK